MDKDKILFEIYEKLHERFGPQDWWPCIGESNKELEICIGAILTQNTSWNNVEKAIKNLVGNNTLNIEKLRGIEEHRLAAIVKSAGYFNQKAKKIKNFVNFVYENYKGSLNALLSLNIPKLRAELLRVNGIGKETADSIVLYAANKPIFVVDAYTKRIMSRFGFKEKSYEDLQNLFMGNLKQDNKRFNEYHALLVKLGKETCKKEPLCGKCPLDKTCIKNIHGD